jgi:serine/threonine-protein kinase
VDYREEMQRALGSGFLIERELPGAGTSLVFVAEELALGRRVVIKMLSSKSAGGVNAERFQREIAVAARLQHPHLVPLLTAGVVSSAQVPWFSMPFVEGESLRELLMRRGPLPLGQGVRLMREIASALSYAHTRGIVHRDIKPENVLLSDSVAMITDFGVAMAVDSAIADGTKGGRRLTGAGTTLGTPAYSAPEQISSAGSVDLRADVYAFGCVAYEILTGAPPFANHNLRELLVAQINEQPVPVLQHRPNVPPVIANLVMRCLQKAPEDRPQSAGEIVRIIDSITLTSLHDTGETPAVSAERLRAAMASGTASVSNAASPSALSAASTSASASASTSSAAPAHARPSRVPLLSLILAVTFILLIVVLIFR